MEELVWKSWFGRAGLEELVWKSWFGRAGCKRDKSETFADIWYELQETLNYWKQVSNILKYFRPEEDPSSRLPQNFMSGFLEVCSAF